MIYQPLYRAELYLAQIIGGYQSVPGLQYRWAQRKPVTSNISTKVDFTLQLKNEFKQLQAWLALGSSSNEFQMTFAFELWVSSWSYQAVLDSLKYSLMSPL